MELKMPSLITSFSFIFIINFYMHFQLLFFLESEYFPLQIPVLFLGLCFE